jgi:beta-galactosidase
MSAGFFTVAAQEARQEVPLNGPWRFITDPQKKGTEAQWMMGLPAPAVEVRVPHTWNIMPGYENYAGAAWYEKDFTVPDHWKGSQVRIQFAAVYHDAVIYINGTKVGQHLNSGYTSFYIDITKHLNYKGQNKLVVLVSNDFSATNLPYGRSFDWCNDGGIIRDVHLVVTGKPSLRYVHVTPEIRFEDTTARAGIDLRLWEENIDRINASIRIREKLSGKLVREQKLVLKKSAGKFSARIDLGRVHLWHFNDPFLYEIQVKLNHGRQVTDSKTSRFGCRQVMLQGKQLLLNQEAVRLPGMEYMPGSHPEYGNAEPRWVMDSVVNMFKDLNVTLSRFHWQVDEYMLDLMDEKGILLQAEIPWWQQPGKLTPELMQTARQQLSEMIERDYNHPCIIAWGISNELYGNDRERNQFVSLKQYVKGLDSSRLVVVVSNETFKRKTEDESFIGDLPTWNEYVGTWFGKTSDELPEYFREIESFIGDRPLLITENGLCEPRFTGGDLRRVDDMIYHYREWAKRDYIAGCIYFCLNDYRTHRGEGGARKFKARIHGITDLYLGKKPSYYVFKRLASPIEITQVKKISDSRVQVELVNKNTLPSYSLQGYKVRWRKPGNVVVENQLPFLKPGATHTLELEDIEERFSFDVLSPAGFRVVSYPVVQ